MLIYMLILLAIILSSNLAALKCVIKIKPTVINRYY